MESKDLYHVLGQIIYSYSRVEFLISNIACDIGLAETPYDFFGNGMFDKKLERLSTRMNELTDNCELKAEITSWLQELKELKMKWNRLLQLIVFQGGREAVFFDYRSKDKKLIEEINSYTADELSALNMDFTVALRNGAKLWEAIKWVVS